VATLASKQTRILESQLVELLLERGLLVGGTHKQRLVLTLHSTEVSFKASHLHLQALKHRVRLPLS